MDFDSAVKIINKLLLKIGPDTFNSSWIRRYAPNIYRFFQTNIRREIGGIDWDRITRALDHKFQRKWVTVRRRATKLYQNKTEVKTILHKYEEKLYTFLNPTDEDDRYVRDSISIALVRLTQKGNIIAKREIVKIVRFTIDEWIEISPKFYRWKGHEHLINERVEGCIRRYRYSGTFIGYLFKTLEYAARGLKPMIACSLDDPIYSGHKNRSDIIGQNPENREIMIGSRNINVP